MISGRQALAEIEKGIAKARAEEARLDKAMQAAAERAGRLRLQRMECFRELARLKLDIARQGIVGELQSVERRALGLLENRKAALEQLSARRREAEEAEQALEAERHARAAALEEAWAAVEAVREKVEAQASGEAGWAAQRARLAEAEAVAAEAEKKAQQAELDRAEKRRPYEADPLFMYLWNKKFGTAEDRSGPFVRFFDRLVARRVGYQEARVNYDLLNRLPDRIRDHCARMREEIEAERARLRAIEREALVAAGIEPLESNAAEARRNLLEAEAKLNEAKERLSAFDREHDLSVLQ
ncbi:MAG TPA: hypothetical protein VM434_19225, partial [Beijerinckiaceae bacterium]|nr:hypothetical protein [Beijerinckiaceae bacterium]